MYMCVCMYALYVCDAYVCVHVCLACVCRYRTLCLSPSRTVFSLFSEPSLA